MKNIVPLLVQSPHMYSRAETSVKGIIEVEIEAKFMPVITQSARWTQFF